MRYYLDIDIDIKNFITNLIDKNVKYEIINENILLTNEGMYRYDNDKLICCKLDNSEPIIIKNFINDYTLIKMNEPWKNSIPKFQIPYDNYKLHLTKYTFLPFDKKDFKFIIELYDSDKIDYYFDTYETDENSFFLKENIGSFLKNLN